MAEKSIGTRIFLGLKICGTISVTLSDSVNCAFICADSQLSVGELPANHLQIVCIFCDIQKAHADGIYKEKRRHRKQFMTTRAIIRLSERPRRPLRERQPRAPRPAFSPRTRR